LSWRDLAREYLPLVERTLQEVVGEGSPLVRQHYGMMRYHLGWVDERFHSTGARGGKRVRPLLCLLSCEAAGGDIRKALPAAAALELVHNFSLVHDDIQDQSPTRRHRLTVWKLWGEALAINVGDGLLALAHLALGRLAGQGVPPEKVVTAFRVLNRACLALTEGQFLDISFETRADVTLEEYMMMIKGKTASLIAASTHLGALVASDDENLVEHYRAFGENLGFAFQIQDDILGLWGDEETTGKPVADDLRQRKKTLPILYAAERNPALGKLLAQEQWGEEEIARALELIERTGAREFAREEAHRFYRKALAELEATGRQNRAQEALADLARFIVEREF